MGKAQCYLHWKFDIYHIYSVWENCNIKVFNTSTPGWPNSHPSVQPASHDHYLDSHFLWELKVVLHVLDFLFVQHSKSTDFYVYHWSSHQSTGSHCHMTQQLADYFHVFSGKRALCFMVALVVVVAFLFLHWENVWPFIPCLRVVTFLSGD